MVGSSLHKNFAGWIVGFSSASAGSVSLLAKFMAIKYDLINLVWDLGYRNYLQSDSLDVIQLLKAPITTASHMTSVLNETLSFASHPYRISFRHVTRVTSCIALFLFSSHQKNRKKVQNLSFIQY